MPTLLRFLALRRTNHTCGHCENQNNPITPQNGFSVKYRATEELDMEVFVHNECADACCRDFGVQLPATRGFR